MRRRGPSLSPPAQPWRGGGRRTGREPDSLGRALAPRQLHRVLGGSWELRGTAGSTEGGGRGRESGQQEAGSPTGTRPAPGTQTSMRQGGVNPLRRPAPPTLGRSEAKREQQSEPGKEAEQTPEAGHPLHPPVLSAVRGSRVPGSKPALTSSKHNASVKGAPIPP